MRRTSPSSEPPSAASEDLHTSASDRAVENGFTVEVDFKKLLPEAADRIDVMLESVESRGKIQAVTLLDKRSEQYWFVRGVILREMVNARIGRGKMGYKVSLFDISSRLKGYLFKENYRGQHHDDLFDQPIDSRFPIQEGEHPRDYHKRMHDLAYREEKDKQKRLSVREEMANALNNAWKDIVEELGK